MPGSNLPSGQRDIETYKRHTPCCDVSAFTPHSVQIPIVIIIICIIYILCVWLFSFWCVVDWTVISAKIQNHTRKSRCVLPFELKRLFAQTRERLLLKIWAWIPMPFKRNLVEGRYLTPIGLLKLVFVCSFLGGTETKEDLLSDGTKTAPDSRSLSRKQVTSCFSMQVKTISWSLLTENLRSCSNLYSWSIWESVTDAKARCHNDQTWRDSGNNWRFALVVGNPRSNLILHWINISVHGWLCRNWNQKETLRFTRLP